MKNHCMFTEQCPDNLSAGTWSVATPISREFTLNFAPVTSFSLPRDVDALPANYLVRNSTFVHSHFANSIEPERLSQRRKTRRGETNESMALHRIIHAILSDKVFRTDFPPLVNIMGIFIISECLGEALSFSIKNLWYFENYGKRLQKVSN